MRIDHRLLSAAHHGTLPSDCGCQQGAALGHEDAGKMLEISDVSAVDKRKIARAVILLARPVKT
jgi:hypothetical protein